MKDKDDWRIVASIDLWISFGLDKLFAEECLKKTINFLEAKKDKMTFETYFHFQSLKNSLGYDLDKTEINRHFNIKRINNMYLINGELGIMDISSIYYYLTLDNVTNNKVKQDCKSYK